MQQLRSGVPLAMIVPAAMSLSTNASMRQIETTSRAAARAEARNPYRSSPEQEAVARRTFMLGLRVRCCVACAACDGELRVDLTAVLAQVAAYGTAASLAGTALLGTAAARYCGIHSLADLKAGVRAWGQSLRAPLQEAAAPLKQWCAAWVPKWHPADDAAEFGNRMRQRFTSR